MDRRGRRGGVGRAAGAARRHAPRSRRGAGAAAVTDPDQTPRLSAGDRAADHALAQLAESFRFLLEISPVNAVDAREEFLADRRRAPTFSYRELAADPDVATAQLEAVDLSAVEDDTLAHLLRAKHREMELQIEMLRARDTADFLPLSVELYGGVSPALLRRAETLLAAVPDPEPATRSLDAGEFLELALAEIEAYRQQLPTLDLHAEIRPDVSGVMVQGDTLLIGPDTAVQQRRAMALVHHEVGTHLVTHVNGSAQEVRLLGVGLASYDETQEGLAVLGEIACGGLTAFRLRQLAARVATVHRRVSGADFVDAFDALVESGIPANSAFTTTMRVYRSGGLTKDAIYLRGLSDLLEHLAAGGRLELLFCGKFSLGDLSLVGELAERGVVSRPVLTPRHLTDPAARGRLARAAQSDNLYELVGGPS